MPSVGNCRPRDAWLPAAPVDAFIRELGIFGSAFGLGPDAQDTEGTDHEHQPDRTDHR